MSVEGDSKLEIDVVACCCSISLRLKNIIEDIKCLTTSFDSIAWKHAFREANFVAYVMVRKDFKVDNFYIWDKTLQM